MNYRIYILAALAFLPNFMHTMEVDTALPALPGSNYLYNALPGDIRRKCLQDWFGLTDASASQLTAEAIANALRILVLQNSPALGAFTYFFSASALQQLNIIPLFFDAVRHGCAISLQYLLENSTVDCNVCDQYGQTMLLIATVEDQIDCIKLLLAQKNINSSLPNKYGYTPLHLAVRKGNVQSTKLLLEAPDITINANSNTLQETPLHLAIKNNHPECVALLLEHPQIDCNKQDSLGNTPLHLAASRNHIAGMQALLKSTTLQTELLNNQGKTALACATSQEAKDLLKDTAQKAQNSSYCSIQ